MLFAFNTQIFHILALILIFIYIRLFVILYLLLVDLFNLISVWRFYRKRINILLAIFLLLKTILWRNYNWILNFYRFSLLLYFIFIFSSLTSNIWLLLLFLFQSNIDCIFFLIINSFLKLVIKHTILIFIALNAYFI